MWLFGVAIYNNAEGLTSTQIIFQREGVKTDPVGIELDPLRSYTFTSDVFGLEDGDYQIFFILPDGCYVTVYQVELEEGEFKGAYIQQLHEVLGD